MAALGGADLHLVETVGAHRRDLLGLLFLLATCLSQIYGESKRGVRAGYAKWETFPVWNLPLKHPVNLAYEAATADLEDLNIIDPFHMQAYGKEAVNYNRDVEAFPVLKALMEGLYGESPYQSPTDMGVNMAGFAITDDAAVRQAAREEIFRRNICAHEYADATGDTSQARITARIVEEVEAQFNA